MIHSSVQRRYYGHPYHNGTVLASSSSCLALTVHCSCCHLWIAAEHAADVAQTLHHFLTVGNLGSLLTERTKCTALLAAIIHDVVSAARLEYAR